MSCEVAGNEFSGLFPDGEMCIRDRFTSKQGADYADNGNGRSAAATAVAFDKNGAGVKTLTAWKALADQGRCV